MPRYHFNVDDGLSLRDDDGIELPDLAAARKEAVKLAGASIREYSGKLWDGDEWKLDVTNNTGMVLFSLLLIGYSAPITANHRADWLSDGEAGTA